MLRARWEVQLQRERGMWREYNGARQRSTGGKGVRGSVGESDLGRSTFYTGSQQMDI